MNNKILYFYIFCIVFFADTYFLISWLRPITILNYLLVLHFIGIRKQKLPSKVNQLIVLYYCFVIFISVVNFYQNDVIKAISALITLIPIPVVFILFYRTKENNKLILFYAKWYMLYNGFFALLQLGGFHYSAGELLANFPLLDVDNTFVKEFGNQGLRISGASYSSIGFACNLGILFCYFYFNETILYTKKVRLYSLIALTIFMMFSQTRSVLFSIIPVIFITNSFLNKNKIKVLMLSTIGIGMVSLIIFLALPIIQERFPRLFLSIEEDGSVVHRIQANVYGVVGTYYLSPIFGVSFDKGLEAMILGYRKIGLFLGFRFIDEVTQHNQPAYFFRYYGIIGFMFFISIYKKFLDVGTYYFNSIEVKKVVFSVVIFHLMYTFSHNNKFTMDIYLWIFISLNSWSKYKRYV